MATTTRRRTVDTCFLSYAVEEEKQARFLKKVIVGLLQETTDVFLAGDPSCIPPGQEWYKGLLKNLRRARTFFALLSPPLAARPWILFESGLAVASRLRIIPLRYNGLTTDLIPDPLRRFQSVDLSNNEEVSELLNSLSTAKTPDRSLVTRSAQKITKHFGRIKPADEAPLFQRRLPSLQDCLMLLSVSSEIQRRLFLHVKDWQGRDGVLESDIRKAVFIPYYRYGQKVKDPTLKASASEYYFRLRELYLLGLLDMEKVSHWENRWSVRPDLRQFLDQRAPKLPPPPKKPR